MSIIRNDLCLIKVVFLYVLKIFVNFSEITLHEKQTKFTFCISEMPQREKYLVVKSEVLMFGDIRYMGQIKVNKLFIEGIMVFLEDKGDISFSET